MGEHAQPPGPSTARRGAQMCFGGEFALTPLPRHHPGLGSKHTQPLRQSCLQLYQDVKSSDLF